MPVEFTVAYAEAAAQASPDVVVTDTVTISHSTFPSDIRFAQSEIDVTIDGDVYLGRQFSIS